MTTQSAVVEGVGPADPAAPSAAGNVTTQSIAAPATTVVAPARPIAEGTAERRRSVRGVRREDVFAIVGSLTASVSATTVLYVWLTPFSGIVGFIVCSYVLFLLVYAVAVAQDQDGPVVRDRLAGAVVHGLALLLLLALGAVIWFTFWRARHVLPHLNFYTQDLHRTGPGAPLTQGGIWHAVVGSLIEIGIALVLTVPLGVLTAVLLNEIPGRLSRLVRTIAEAATALPSIVAGLFIYGVLIVSWRRGGGNGLLPKSGLAAAVALGIMMLPIIIRASDVVLRLVSGSLKEASYALGAGQWQTVWRVTLPTARSGLATAVILGTARGIGETSPVLLCAGYSTLTNTDPTENPMTSLPLAVFTLIKASDAGMVERGFGAAAVLMILVLVLFISARLLARRKRSLRP